jgi:DNA-binding beta-propeller fold protein YncE
MAAQQGIRRSWSGRIALKNIIRLIPAVVILAATLNTVSCGNSGLLTPVNSGSNTPTATPTTGTGALAFVTNFNDGMVSSFTRNTTTGVLKLKSQMTAGAKKGPKGVVAAPSGSFLYVANNKDGNIYQFSINPTNGALTPLAPASISNGSGSGPDEIAINPAGTFLWVTGAGDGTVTTYAINSSTGQLTNNGQVKGFSSPFGIAVDSGGNNVYLADHGSGLVYWYSVGAAGALSIVGTPIPDLGVSAGAPGFIAIDPSGSYIYVTDLSAGVLSVIQTIASQLAFILTQPSSTSANVPIGIGYATVGGFGYVFTANQGGSTLWSFQLTGPGNPVIPVAFGSGNVSAPTDLVVDPQNAFLYTTNQNAGTVSQFSLNPTCSGAPGPPCFVGSVATESPANSNSGPFGITLAQ